MLYLPREVSLKKEILGTADVVSALGGFLLGAFFDGVPIAFAGVAAAWFSLRYVRRVLAVTNIPFETEKMRRAVLLFLGTIVGGSNRILFGFIPGIIVWLLFVYQCLYLRLLSRKYRQSI